MVVGVVGTSGVANLKIGQFENLKIYPNPAVDNVSVEGATGCELTIFNTLGQTVVKDNITNAQQTENISGLADGVYTIQLINGNGYKKNVKLLKE